MTERPEFVPVFLQSATDIKEFLLSQIPDAVPFLLLPQKGAYIVPVLVCLER